VSPEHPLREAAHERSQRTRRFRGRFGICAKSGHKPKLHLSEKAYLLGRWDLSSIELKKHAFLLTIGRAISGQPEEPSKTGVCRGGRMELRQEQVVEKQ
jgi:hypothetical protein